MPKLSIDQLDLKGKRVLMRVDFNVPQDKKTGAITNNAAHRRRVADDPICARSRGRRGAHEPSGPARRQKGRQVQPAAGGRARSRSCLGRPVKFLDDCVGPEVEQACAALKPGEVVLLENLRFHIEEEGKIKDEKTGDFGQGRPGKGGSVSRLADQAGRCLRQRCLRHRAPRPQLHGRRQAAAARGRLSHEEGAGRLRARCSTIHAGRCWPSSAAPRSPTKFSSSAT